MVYQICKMCILDTNIPDIHFNQDGVCNFCEEYAKRSGHKAKWNAPLREEEFLKVVRTNLSKYKYDCLCLYSGGKDSTYMLYHLVSRLKLRVLAFTLDNWFLAPQTYNNIKNVVSHLKVDHMFYKPDWDTAAYLFRVGVENFNKTKESRKMSFLVGHVCWPCFVMISVFSMKTAIEKNIPNVIIGTTPGQLTQKTNDLLTKYQGALDVYLYMIKPFLSILDQKQKKKIDLTFLDKMKSLRLRLVPFYESFKYSEEAAFSLAQEKLNWVKPQDTDSCSTNCLINALGIAIHKKQHNVSPYLIPLAYDVREGLVKREEALKALNTPVNEKIVKDAAIKLGLSIKGIV